MQLLATFAGLLWVGGMVVFGTLSLLAIILVLGAVVMGNRREYVFAETVDEEVSIPQNQPQVKMSPVAARSSEPVSLEHLPHGQKPIPAGA